MSRESTSRAPVAAHFARAAALTALATAGCGGTIDMRQVYEPTQPHTVIAYTGVQEETRLYPDYGAIHADVLRPEAGSPAASP